MTRLGMVIDLAKCNGCGACAFACKAENNTRDRGHEQSFNWADFLMKTEGIFPKTTHSVIPVLCNHCSDAPCVKICPGNPEKAGNPTKDPNGKPWKAMYKTPEGITLHDPALCVGCGDCQKACPYSQEKLGPSSLDGGSYSVISLNPRTRTRSRAGPTRLPPSPAAPPRAPKSRPWPAPCRPCSTPGKVAICSPCARTTWLKNAPSATTA
jgi:Fe-S-cluster-containing dehydrogenase component